MESGEWSPRLTVAAIIERDGRFLLVEEYADGEELVYNQPAGHLECREALTDAVSREVLEETAYRFVPKYLVGVYNWRNEAKDLTYLRFTFGGDIVGHDAGRTLDEGIIAAHWLTLDEIQARQASHRSPMLMRCIDDWLAGRRYPLDLLVQFP